MPERAGTPGSQPDDAGPGGSAVTPRPTAAVGGVETVVERRERITAQVREWSEHAYIGEEQIDGAHPDLSDEAALLIAVGYLDEDIREILTTRRRAGRGLPRIGGYAELRALSDEHARTLARARAAKTPISRGMLRLRAADLLHQLHAKRQAFINSDEHFAKSARAARRDKRDGVHLDPEQRLAIFDALRRTPAPMPSDSEHALHFMGPFSFTAEQVAKFSEGTRRFMLGRTAGPRVPDFMADPGQFADRYDTLLYLAGTLYDRISNSSAWHSDHFILQRGQLDLAEELRQIAVDTAALRVIVTELNGLDAASNEVARQHIQDRFAALVPVWDQLVDRVAALARIGDLLTQAEYKLRTINTVRRAKSLDNKIDDLISRSGLREISAKNTHEVGDQFGDVETALDAYQDFIGGDIAALTMRR